MTKKLIKKYEKRFNWIVEFLTSFTSLLFCYGIEVKDYNGYFDFISPPDINNIEKKIIEKQWRNLSKLNLPSKNIKDFSLEWLRYIYQMEKQIWNFKDMTPAVGNPILIFYGMEVMATLLIGEQEKTFSHKKVRDNLKLELEKIGWENLIFPFSAIRKYKEWNKLNKLNKINKDKRGKKWFKILEQSAFGSNGREFREIFYDWETYPSDKSNKKRQKFQKEKRAYYVYFYDFFHKYSVSMRYRGIIPCWQDSQQIDEFSKVTSYLFSCTITFFETLLYFFYQDKIKNLFKNNLSYSKYYLPHQNERWNLLRQL